ncbi:hypothetical protein [Ammoniphilus oxalaticus]|nr:hypothetical protein [Ammoniphilus oxalaticus]
MIESMSESRVSERYKISSLSFNEYAGDDALDQSIEAVYEIRDSPPYQQINNVSVSHQLIDRNSVEKQLRTVGEFLTEMKNEQNVRYKRSYRFHDQKLVIKEDLTRDHDHTLEINDRIVDHRIERWPSEVIGPEPALNLRYKNVGFVMKTDQNSGQAELIVVQQTAPRLWRIRTFNETGLLIERQYSLRALRQEAVMVKAVNLSGAHDGRIGYRSQITQGYPTYLFPILYPYGTSLLSVALILYYFAELRPQAPSKKRI